MHCVTKMERQYHPFVCKTAKVIVDRMIETYNHLDNDSDINEYTLMDFFEQAPKNKNEFFEAIVMNCPIGLELRAEVTTNYLQLKNIYSQRKSHKMGSWKQFCKWIERLPNSEFVIEHK